MNIRSILLAGLIAIISQAAFAQRFIEQFDLEGRSSFYAVNVFGSRIIVSGSKSIVAGVESENHTFVYDEAIDSSYVLDIYELSGIWKQELKDSLLLLLTREFDNKTGALVKYNLITSEKDSVHLKPPPEWRNMIIGDMHLADDHIFISALAFNAVSDNVERTSVSAILKYDFDLNLVATFRYNEFEESSCIVSLADDGNHLKVIVNKSDFQEVDIPEYINYLVNVSFDGEVISTPFTNRSDYEARFPYTGGNYPIAITSSGNTLFGVNTDEWGSCLRGSSRMLLHCVSPAGELLWTYENFSENCYRIDARAYHFEDIHVTEDGSILVSGHAFRNAGHERFFETAFVTSLNEDGSHNWTKLFYYKPGYVPAAHAETLDFEPDPMVSSFRGIGVGASGDVYVAGSADFLPRFNNLGVSISEDTAPLFARLDNNGCLSPQCETETIIGEPAVPNSTVVPGRSWIEQHWAGTDTLTSHYRYAQDSIYEAGRYYVPVELYNPATARYEPTEYALRELTGMTIVRLDSVDHIINDKLMEVGAQAPFVASYPGNIPFLPVQFRVLERDSVVTYDGETRLRMIYDCPQLNSPDVVTYTWLDGIGRLEGMFSVFQDCEEPIRGRIACVRDGETIIYKAADFENCDIINSTRRADAAQEIRLYPNPTAGELNITNLPQGSQVALYDALGSLVLRTRAARIDVSALPGGVYWVNIVFGGRSVTRKVVVR